MARYAMELIPGAAVDDALRAAETLLAQGKPNEAAAMYQLVGNTDLPKHFRMAAAHGALESRQ